MVKLIGTHLKFDLFTCFLIINFCYFKICLYFKTTVNYTKIYTSTLNTSIVNFYFQYNLNFPMRHIKFECSLKYMEIFFIQENMRPSSFEIKYIEYIKPLTIL